MDTKKLAAEKAVEWIEDNMIVGLGTGSTAYWAIKKIGEKVQEGLNIKAVATSRASENLAKEVGVPIVPFSSIEAIDLTIDGADEVDKNKNLIKGGGGALLREKIVAFNSKKLLVVVDESKLVEQLGKFSLPVEILPFASELTIKQIEKTGGVVQVRQANGKNFLTDNGNLIVDLHVYPIADPALLNEELHLIPGVIETGLFLHAMVCTVIVGTNSGEIKVI